MHRCYKVEGLLCPLLFKKKAYSAFKKDSDFELKYFANLTNLLIVKAVIIIEFIS